MKTSLRERARRLKTETYALILAYRDPRTPWVARLWTALVVAYAFSPIDLIPDFVPVLGYLDDVILVPLGIVIALRLIPVEVLADARAAAHQQLEAGERPFGTTGAILVVAIWLIGLGLMAVLMLRLLRR
jgi:uncharacterized membrane protein YkvA (DUF1232 family)